MVNPKPESNVRMEMANRLFFRLYQCANMLHKTGTRAVEPYGLTTQQWAILGALSRPEAAQGISMGELARYLMVSRQNLSGVMGRMERDGHVHSVTAPSDRRSRLIAMTGRGRELWQRHALPTIFEYYEKVLDGFSTRDITHVLHYLMKLLENMESVDKSQPRAW